VGDQKQEKGAAKANPELFGDFGFGTLSSSARLKNDGGSGGGGGCSGCKMQSGRMRS
jgi:hypothetical protein